MKQFSAFIKKEFFHILRDPQTIIILLIIPIMLIVLFGFAITNEVKNVKVGVLDMSKDVATQRITEKFRASTSFNLVATLNSEEEINRYFETDKVSLVIIFEEGFAKNLFRSGKGSIQLISDASSPNISLLSTNYAKMIINSYQNELMQEIDIPIKIVPEVQMLYNPIQKDAYNFVPGIIGFILTLICALMTANSIVKEKETGSMEVLLVSPIKPVYIIVSKLIPYFVLSVVDLILILFLSVYVLNVPIVGNLFSLFTISLLFIAVSLSIGILISTIAKSQLEAMLMSGMLLLVPVMLLSGMIFPISNMPLPLQWISDILPATWYVSAIKKIMIEGLSISHVVKEIAVMLIMGVILLFVSVKNFKTKLE